MAFIKIFPFSDKYPRAVKTTNEIDNQIWQELSAIRFQKRTKLAGRKAIAPWIDQAKVYYCDAKNASWRSAGLSYYYSFLNIVKALLVAKKLFSFKLLNTTSLYHGLKTDLQSIKLLPEFEISIFQAASGNRLNVFANLYKLITDHEWPFSNPVKIKLNDILPYCNCISTELADLFNIQSEQTILQSLLRLKLNTIWLEILTPNTKADSIINTMPKFLVNKKEQNNFDKLDMDDWYLAYNQAVTTFIGRAFIQTKEYTFNEQDQRVIAKKLLNDFINNFKGYAYPSETESIESPHWLFFPKINISNEKLFWHSFLSDYLFSFALSSILRYQPQILKVNSINEFIAEAWVKQAPLSMLRNILLYFTNPPLRVERW